MEKVTRARQYARAFFALTRKTGQVDRAAAELHSCRQRIAASRAAQDFLYHPEIPAQAKTRVLERLLPESLLPDSSGLLHLLTAHRDLALLPEIHEAFLSLRHEISGLLKAEVETARPLSRSARDRLQQALAQATGRTVVIQEKTNPELLGGARVRIGDEIVDASVAGRLNQMRERLVGENSQPLTAKGSDK